MADCSRVFGIDIGGTSIKAALMDGEREVWTGRSGEYARPGREELVGAMRDLIADSPMGRGMVVRGVGVCAPGLRDAAGVITRAVNAPGLEGMSAAALVEEVGSGKWEVGSVREFTDAYAAAVDFWHMRRASGRMLAMSMGTGIGACVLDEGGDGRPVALIVSGRGPGQIGQMDVSVGGSGADVPIGPDGGRGTLEAYMGLPALRARFGDDLAGAVAAGGLSVDRVPLAALVRALRIAHAIYVPERVVLLGGVGMGLGALARAIREAVADGLTPLAKREWTLEVGVTSFHAARGAARLAREVGPGV